nr:type I inositol polyphosphate 5-phosphatase 8-like isoform X1 [Ipomoea batatas]
MFVGTWNVGGKTPYNGSDLREWLNTSPPAHIYVLGFQEIVPLNAGNVLGAEDSGPAAKWLSLIRETLNNGTTDPIQQRVSFSDLISLEEEDFERFVSTNSVSLSSEQVSSSPNCTKKNQYCLVASKQMVGLFLCIWVLDDLHQHVQDLKVSCVGRGIMGYLGNKGSISISMTLHQTTFCFVCTHLASGEKEGDEVRRNSDVMEILRRTRFNHLSRMGRQSAPHPDKILDHDKIIWLGDLNYRLASGSEEDTFELLKKSDWQALLEKDQLKMEQKAGRVFKGWKEGRIYFPPTYKYLSNSEHYVVQTSAPSKQKQRTPAWGRIKADLLCSGRIQVLRSQTSVFPFLATQRHQSLAPSLPPSNNTMPCAPGHMAQCPVRSQVQFLVAESHISQFTSRAGAVEAFVMRHYPNIQCPVNRSSMVAADSKLEFFRLLR